MQTILPLIYLPSFVIILIYSHTYEVSILLFSELTSEYPLPDEDETMKFIDQHQFSFKSENEAIVPTVYVEERSPESIPSPTEASIYISHEPVKPEPVLQENRQLEFLIDAVMSCQDAVYPNLKKHYSVCRHQEHFKIFVSFNKYFFPLDYTVYRDQS